MVQTLLLQDIQSVFVKDIFCFIPFDVLVATKQFEEFLCPHFILVRCVLWHINPRGLFNARFCFFYTVLVKSILDTFKNVYFSS